MFDTNIDNNFVRHYSFNASVTNICFQFLHLRLNQMLIYLSKLTNPPRRTLKSILTMIFHFKAFTNQHNFVTCYRNPSFRHLRVARLSYRPVASLSASKNFIWEMAAILSQLQYVNSLKYWISPYRDLQLCMLLFKADFIINGFSYKRLTLVCFRKDDIWILYNLNELHFF